jgi:hypothetical protein
MHTTYDACLHITALLLDHATSFINLQQSIHNYEIISNYSQMRERETRDILLTCVVEGKIGDGVLRWSGFRITIRPVESSDIRQTSFILYISDILIDVR